jgi:membrane fusion protein, multidrug efflux system
MAKKFLLTAFALIAVIGSLVGIKVQQFKTMFAAQAHAAVPPESVATSQVQKNTFAPSLVAVGTVTAYQGVTLNAEVAGTIKRIAFDSGVSVKAGDVLVELDVSVEKAQLQSAQANLELARSNLASGRSLVDSGAMPKNQFVSLDAQAKQAEAEVSRLTAVIAKKTIRAPFAGRVGIRQVNLGQFVGNGDVIASLQSLDPVYVDFALPQQRLSQLQVGAQVHVTTDVFPDASFDGALSAINPQVESATRSIKLRATLKNPEGRLRPGMFAKAEVSLPGTQDILLLPVTAVTYAPYGDSVFVVEKTKNEKTRADELVVHQKFVRLGASRGDFVVVTDGLNVGEDVVVTGSFKLHNGSPVLINNSLRPESSESPKPTDS